MLQTSGLPVPPTGSHVYDLDAKEESRPAVFLMSNAAAYTAWYAVRSSLQLNHCRYLISPLVVVCPNASMLTLVATLVTGVFFAGGGIAHHHLAPYATLLVMCMY